MPYILYKSNSAVLTTVDDATLDTTTDLSFVGRNYSGYGQAVNENFLKLLENFANSTPPTTPLIGELWYDTANGRINVNYGGDSKSFKSIANMYVGSSINPPKTATTSEGDLWWNTTNGQLYAKHGSEYVLVGPPQVSTVTKSYWQSQEYATGGRIIPFLEGIIGTEVVATLSLESTPLSPAPDAFLQNSSFDMLKKGVTLRGVDSNGSSILSGYYFWGTSTESLRSNTSTNALSVTISQSVSNNKNYINFSNTTTGATNIMSDPDFYYDSTENVVYATASSAYYADLAERYASDAEYDVGTVLIIGGDKEVTTTSLYAHPSVAGIVSRTPAYRMNTNAGPDNTHPYVALKGRVPCKVVGKVTKGDRLVTSQVPGYAAVDDGTNPYAGLVGIALANQLEGMGLVEVKV